MKLKYFIIVMLTFLTGLIFSKYFSVTARDVHPAVSEKIENKVLYYQNPMNPTIVSKTPAKDNMGMDYIPVYEESAENGEGEKFKSSSVQGRSSFHLASENQQIIGLTTAKVELRNISSEIRASGSVAFDPDLFTALSEYRQAVKGKLSLKNENLAELKDDADQLITASRTRLRLLGLTNEQISLLSRETSNPMNLLLPKGHVWIYAEVYEYEIAKIRTGQKIEVSSDSAPGKIFEGKLSSISPIINPSTRTVRVRGLVPDPENSLRPDSYVNVKILNSIGEKLSIPTDSVLHTGEHDFVFLVSTQNSFEPHEVKVGASSGPYVEVLSGLKQGDTVVTAAQFLIDSESRLRSAIDALKNEGAKK